MHRTASRPWHHSEARPGFGWLTLRRYVLFCILLVLASWLAGSYRMTLQDESGWCVHFNSFMVCSATAATDSVLDAPGPAPELVR